MTLSKPQNSVTPEQLEEQITAELAEVERQLEDAILSDQPIISEMSGHLMHAGGKRIRPQLVMLAGRFGNAEDPRLLTAAVVCELTHLASLYHDDVMDEADVRRGVESANHRWDNTLSILTGDYLFAQSSHVGSSLGVEMSRLHSRMTKRLVAGQIRETVGPLFGQDPMRHYVKVAQDKTGALISSACQLGAFVSDVPETYIEPLAEYGESLGMAFQYSDDILDVTADVDQFGKATGQDVREGIASLPVLHARRSTEPEDVELVELLGQDLSHDDEGAKRAISLLRESSAIERSRSDLHRVVDAAVRALDVLPDIAARQRLVAIAEGMLSRVY